MNLDDAASSLRAAAADKAALLQALAGCLADIPGLQLQVVRRRGKLRRIFGDIPYVNDFQRRSAPVSAIRVQVGDRLFELESTGPKFDCFSGPSGSAGSRKNMPFPEWMAGLVGELAEMSRVSAGAIEALENLLIGGGP